MHRKLSLSKMFFTLLFGLSTVLSFGQDLPPPPPDETPINSNIYVLITLGILLHSFTIAKKSFYNTTKK